MCGAISDRASQSHDGSECTGVTRKKSRTSRRIRGWNRRDGSAGQATAATAAKVSVALKMMTVRVSISITAWPKRLVDSVGALMFEVFIGVFSEVAQTLCRSRQCLTLRRLRSNRDGTNSRENGPCASGVDRSNRGLGRCCRRRSLRFGVEARRAGLANAMSPENLAVGAARKRPSTAKRSGPSANWTPRSIQASCLHL